MEIRARMWCSAVDKFGNPGHEKDRGTVNGAQTVERVHLQAIFSQDPNDPNKTYADASPTASFDIHIVNPKAWGCFQPGHIYDVSFTPTPGMDATPKA